MGRPRFAASRPIDKAMTVEEGTLVRYGRPLEIARAVAFLAGNESSYVTGQVMRVDGNRRKVVCHVEQGQLVIRRFSGFVEVHRESAENLAIAGDDRM